jgi:CheY-like chemotaxis protein
MQTVVALRTPPTVGLGAETEVPKVLVVDPKYEAYRDLAGAARRGDVLVHFRSSGQAARALMKRVWFDVCIVGEELDDMAGEDFLELLRFAAEKPCGDVVASTAAPVAVGHALAAIESSRVSTGGEHRSAIPSGLNRVSESLVLSAVAAVATMGVLLTR